jgi:hypothetical protein
MFRPGIESRSHVALATDGETVSIHCFSGRERHIFKERSDYENSRLLTELPGESTVNDYSRIQKLVPNVNSIITET